MPMNFILKFSSLILTKNYNHTSLQSQKHWTVSDKSDYSERMSGRPPHHEIWLGPSIMENLYSLS